MEHECKYCGEPAKYRCRHCGEYYCGKHITPHIYYDHVSKSKNKR